MLKTYTVSAVIVVIMLVAVIGIISCANEAEENISVSLVFIDEFTGDPIQGVEMFIHQAVFQFELWTARKAPVESMRRVVMESLR